jgi:hypothetical protein
MKRTIGLSTKINVYLTVYTIFYVVASMAIQLYMCIFAFFDCCTVLSKRNGR